MIEVPGLTLPHPAEDSAPVRDAKELDESALKDWLEKQPRCTSNAHGTVEGDPLNLVVVGDRASIQECLSTWDETESITLGTSWKTARAFLLESQYRYSPVSPLYLYGRQQDFALQRARASLNQRLHLRLWTTDLRFDGQQVWIGQVSRDIGVRFTAKDVEPHHSSDRSQCRRIARLRARRSARVAPRVAPGLRRWRRACTRRLTAPQPDRRSLFHRRPARSSDPLAHAHYA